MTASRGFHYHRRPKSPIVSEVFTVFMSTAKQSTRAGLATPWGNLPARMKALFVTTHERTGGWLAEALAGDRACRVVLEEACGAAAGLAHLRDQVYDAVLVSHEPGLLDALEFAEGLRAGGAEEPLVVLGPQSEEEMSALCYEVGADAYLCVHTTTTRTLLWTVARAVERASLIRETRRLTQADKQRLQQEHEEAERLLGQQRGILRELESLDASDSESPLAVASALAESATAPERIVPCGTSWSLPHALVSHYRELLRAHVIMGSGNLNGEMGALAEMLVAAGVSAQQTMKLHLHVVEELIRGLGSRSARHVMTRADLLVLEVLVHLAEGYRRQYLERVRPPRQRLLPGLHETPAI